MSVPSTVCCQVMWQGQAVTARRAAAACMSYNSATCILPAAAQVVQENVSHDLVSSLVRYARMYADGSTRPDC